MFTRRDFLRKSLTGACALTAWGIPGVQAVLRGLPSTAAEGAAKKKILILGAGLAGMSAALELLSAGHDVTILEANTYPGGRVHTLRAPFSDGLFAEAGAARIPDWHDLTRRYIKDFGLETESFRPSTGKNVLHLRGKRYVLAPGEDLPLADLPFEFSADERKLNAGDLEAKYIDPVLKNIGDPRSPGWPSPEYAKLDSLTWEEALRQRGASQGAIDFMVALSGFEEDSALDFFRDDLGHRGAKFLSRIPGGNDRLPYALAAKLARKITYGAEVVKIQQNAGAVQVKFRQAGLLKDISSSRVICTIPFSVLRHLEVSPHFSAPKQEVVEKLYMDPVVRVFAQTRRRFWEDEGLTGWASTDDPLDIWQPTFSQPGPRGILHTYVMDGLTLRLSKMSPEDRIRHSLDSMRRCFPQLPEHLETTYQWCWGDQPYARGAYTVFNAGQLVPWSKIAREPEGRIHFAGEHASAFPGWMQGAFESGLRVAHDVHTAQD